MKLEFVAAVAVAVEVLQHRRIAVGIFPHLQPFCAADFGTQRQEFLPGPAGTLPGDCILQCLIDAV